MPFTIAAVDGAAADWGGAAGAGAVGPPGLAAGGNVAVGTLRGAAGTFGPESAPQPAATITQISAIEITPISFLVRCCD